MRSAAQKAAFALLCGAALLAPATAAHAAEEKPAWLLSSTALPTNFPAGAQGEDFGGPAYLLVATNVGGKAATGEVTITDTLPSGVSPAFKPNGCEVSGQEVICTNPKVKNKLEEEEFLTIGPGDSLAFRVTVDVDPLAAGTLQNEATVEGGGADPAAATTTTQVSSTPAPFDFLEGFRAPLNEADGTPATLAGSHPYQFTASMGFPTEKSTENKNLGGAGHLRDASVDLPPGLIVNPASTPVLCTELELTSEGFPGCPDESQVGIVEVTTITSGAITVPAPLYNMVPPPGMAASLGLDALGVGVFVHVGGGVRSDGDYGITGGVKDTLALVNNPVFGAQLQLWGDPSAKSHDGARGDCLGTEFEESCPVDPQETALLTLPGDCPGKPELFLGHAKSWEQPTLVKEAGYESADLDGTPSSISGCGGLAFEPSIEAKPTTSVTDSPSGLDFHLRQSQDTRLAGRSPTVVKDATVTLPAGMVVNPSSADGQAACTSAQIGLLTLIGQTPIHFSKDPALCPDAAKVGTVEVKTPLLAEIDPDTNKVQRDAKGNAIPRPLHGSVYLAKPFDNPFGSLLAIYFSVEDPKSGTVAKFAGRVHADPVTGQLSTLAAENPQLPLQDVRLELFKGPRASLRTPPACATHTTTSQMVPWSGPEAAKAPSDAFATTAAPGGGPCPASAPTAPHQPSLVAGTLAPTAGAFSPLVAKLSREDGSQEIAGFEITLPPGLSAKPAGVPYCTEAEIAQAKARSHPNEGALELANPSCPAASQLGTLDVAAGAGPTPLHTAGRLYWAGPYKGAPVSTVAITPAIAGPFDLGVVTVRAPLYIDPTTAQARAVSDPLPTILEGIPLDVRSATVRVDRPNFSLNPTSCAEKAFAGTATSTFGALAPLSARFQVGGCKSLPYKPKMALRLFGPIHRGGHPRFRSVFTAKPGEANTKRVVLALPRSEFIDQGHFRTICTRVQFAANQCPAGSIYGHIKATTPLVDYPLQGPIYLRSSSHELPDAVLVLKGPPTQPIEVDLVAHVDSVNGGLRFTVEGVPDAPVTKAIITAQGGRKGLFQNSTNICKGTHRATLKLDGQNGKAHDSRPLLAVDCPKGKGHGKGDGGKRP